MSRIVSAGVLVFDQPDVFLPGAGFNRAEGLDTSAVELTAFVNNVALPWPLTEGAGVADSSISSGAIYFNEIPGSPGFYSLRFFPDRVGFWKLNLSFISLATEIPREFEVAPKGLFQAQAKGTLVATTTQ